MSEKREKKLFIYFYDDPQYNGMSIIMVIFSRSGKTKKFVKKKQRERSLLLCESLLITHIDEPF